MCEVDRCPRPATIHWVYLDEDGSHYTDRCDAHAWDTYVVGDTPPETTLLFEPRPMPEEIPTTPFEHLSTVEAWDTYVVGDTYEVAVCYRNNDFAALYIKNKKPGSFSTIEFTDLDDITSLLTALHAAAAGTYKKGTNGKQSIS